ncbi:DHS-like NAD/FAD-binding domain-containing protein [Pterulicium gracile]|uniref:DHS-like NAD/FAD-binding domain-containing protein n=1 Tax=Pterulicium gracile TaxID=1884261 RepID=A0A5C3QET0_9AGAR|nr:DHS-like NAD/FAD-binding domain-containing protein [Pterula gracilis]
MGVTTLELDASQDASTRRTLSDLSLAVAKSKRIVVVTGAGISCSSGIPDFRSSDGLYNLVKAKYPNTFLKGKDLFDASLFRDPDSTSLFYTFISSLKRSIDSASPTPTHKFIKTLDTKGKLLRSYTQNIDGLEADAGLLCSSSEEAKGKGKMKMKKDVRNVQLHGDLRRVRCVTCSAEYKCTEEHLVMFNEGNAPDCPDCSKRSEARVARSARRLRVGSLRPAIVLYDEPHPLGDDIGLIQSSDLARKPDLLIVMGTSLKVHGLKKLVKEFAKTVHASSSSPTSSPGASSSSQLASSSSQPSSPPKKGGPKKALLAHKVIFVNKTPPAGEWADIIDYHVQGTTDAWAEHVEADWRRMRPADWEVQQTLGVGEGGLKVVRATGLKIKIGKGKGKGKHPHGPNEDSNPVVASNSNPSPFPQPAAVPSSPSKRRQPTSHYHEPGSPPKKQAVVSGSRSRAASPVKRGLLFGDSTNVSGGVRGDEDEDEELGVAGDEDEEDGVDLGKLALNDAEEDDDDEEDDEEEEGEGEDIIDVDADEDAMILTPLRPLPTARLKRTKAMASPNVGERKTPAKRAAVGTVRVVRPVPRGRSGAIGGRSTAGGLRREASALVDEDL